MARRRLALHGRVLHTHFASNDAAPRRLAGNGAVCNVSNIEAAMSSVGVGKATALGDFLTL